MKILMLTWEYPPRIVGGIARVVHDLSKRLIKDGHEVTVVTYKEGDLPDYENDKGVKVYRVNNYMINPNNFIDWIMQLNFNLVAKATEIIQKEGPFDVIHAHDWLVAYAAKTLKMHLIFLLWLRFMQQRLVEILVYMMKHKDILMIQNGCLLMKQQK